jgi:hypothetical protein
MGFATTNGLQSSYFRRAFIWHSRRWPDVCSRDFLLLALPSGQLVTGRVTAPARIAAD